MGTNAAQFKSSVISVPSTAFWYVTKIGVNPLQKSCLILTRVPWFKVVIEVEGLLVVSH